MDRVVAELLDRLVEANVPPNFLNDTVEGEAASQINSGGFRAQLEYLLREWGEQNTRLAVEEVIEEAARVFLGKRVTVK